jgi:hypothetical protein
MGEKRPFDPSDPVDACTETVRRAMTDAAISIHETALFRGLTPTQQLEVLVAGMTVATVGVAFSLVAPKHRNDMLAIIRKSLPAAAVQARAIIRNGEAAEQGASHG